MTSNNDPDPSAEQSWETNAWQILVDQDLCQGHGVCENEAPGIFSVSKSGVLTVQEARPPDNRKADVEMAVKYCPTHALAIKVPEVAQEIEHNPHAEEKHG